MLIQRFMFFCLAVLASFTVQAQASKSGIGTGVSIQYGLNSRSDVVVWGLESQNIQLAPQKRVLAGPVFQYKNFKRFQVESGILMGQTRYVSGDGVVTPQDQVTVKEFQLPLNAVYNSPSPVKFHSSIVYHAGLSVSRFVVPRQGIILKKYTFMTPSFNAGVRLSTEIRSFGRVEYGIQYVRNFKEHMSFPVENDDALPTLVSIQQRTGQFRLNFIYYFTPRMYNWSKTRYNLNGLD